MDINRVVNHLKSLETIAFQNSGSRTALTGYNASVDYVISQLEQHTDYKVLTDYVYQIQFFCLDFYSSF